MLSCTEQQPASILRGRGGGDMDTPTEAQKVFLTNFDEVTKQIFNGCLRRPVFIGEFDV